MALLEILEHFEGRLTKADQKLVNTLLENPAEGMYLSSSELAKVAGVHPATVMRLARKLGFKNYSELKGKLLENSSLITKGAERIKSRLDKMGKGFILESLIKSEIQALESIADHIGQKQMSKAARWIISSDQVVVFGIGHATSLADLLARRLNRSGYRAFSFSNSGWELPEELLKIAKGTVVVAFAFRKIPSGLSALIQHTRDVGGNSIVISDFIGPVIRPQPDLLLSAYRGKEGEAQSLTVPMVICNALILEISNSDGGHSLASLESLAQIREDLQG